MITFRLADALPLAKLVELEHELSNRPDAEWQKRLESLLDAGFGACHLKQPKIARLVENALLYFDGARYHLLARVIMPNHVHVLIETMPDSRVSDVIQSRLAL